MKFLFAAAALLIATSAHAQTHPCDVTPPTNPTLTTSVVLGWCHDLKDLDGNPTTLTAFKVNVDGVQVQNIANPQPIGVASATGFFFYESLPITVTKNQHTFTVRAVDVSGESSDTLVYNFTSKVNPRPPTKPRARSR